MTRGQFLFPMVCLLMMGGLAVFFKLQPEVRQDQPKVVNYVPSRKPQQLQVVNPPAIKNTPAVTETTDVLDNTTSSAEPDRPGPPPMPEFVRPPSANMDSSWENPFEAKHWQSTGWRFSLAGMETDGTDHTAATFERAYQKVMLECDILASGAPASTWELHLASENGATTKIVVQTDRVKVLKTEHGVSQPEVEKLLNTRLTSGAPHQFRIVATGNRIVVSWDGRRLLATEQPASQSGHELVWSIHTAGGEFRIPRLRVEGD